MLTLQPLFTINHTEIITLLHEIILNHWSLESPSLVNILGNTVSFLGQRNHAMSSYQLMERGLGEPVEILPQKQISLLNILDVTWIPARNQPLHWLRYVDWLGNFCMSTLHVLSPEMQMRTGDGTFLRSDGTYQRVYTTSKPRWWSSSLPLWEPNISQSQSLFPGYIEHYGSHQI